MGKLEHFRSTLKEIKDLREYGIPRKQVEDTLEQEYRMLKQILDSLYAETKGYIENVYAMD